MLELATGLPTEVESGEIRLRGRQFPLQKLITDRPWMAGGSPMATRFPHKKSVK